CPTRSGSRGNCNIGCSPTGWCGARKAPKFRRGMRRLLWLNISSRDRDSAVDRQDLAGDHTGFVTSQIERCVGDVFWLDQAEQMRVGKPGQRNVARYYRL